MLIPRARLWSIAERDVTSEAAYLSRRQWIAGSALGAAFIAAPRHVRAAALPPGVSGTVNTTYAAGRALTAERIATTYNNYYEIDTDKDIWQAAQKVPQRPWTIAVDGLVAKKQIFDIDDLIRKLPLEQRIYRHRCVEGWAMTVPWSGFPLHALLDRVQPSADAKYVVFTTLADEKTMPGLADPAMPFPYTEGLSIEEAHNDLAFLATGLYGRPMPPQDGGPIRLVVPWKYGFKSAKALVKITLAKDRPMNFWQAIQPSEYGFWANVNPAVPHPRWSQATERLLGTDDIAPTQIYNGYGQYVAGIYTGLTAEKLFM